MKTAIIGCGPRSNEHANAARSGSGLEIAYACDLDLDRACEHAKKWGAEPCCDYRRALDDPGLEAVIIVTDVGSHVAIAREVIDAGKHLIIEKPLGSNLAAVRELTGIGEKSGLVIYVSYQIRFSRERMRMHELAARVDPIQVFCKHQRGMMKPQFLNPAPFCGIMDVCAHDFDQVLWMMGRAPVAVTATVGRNTFTANTDAADTLSALIEFGEGRSALVFAGIGAAEIGKGMAVVGARGNLSSATRKAVLFDRNDPDNPTQTLDLSCDGNDTLDLDQQKAFVNEIRTGQTSCAARLRDGLNSVLLTLGCLKSAETGKRVFLDELQA